MGCKGVDWIELAQDNDKWYALVNTVINCWVPYNLVNFLTNWGTSSFSRMSLLHAVSPSVCRITTLKMTQAVSPILVPSKKRNKIEISETLAVVNMTLWSSGCDNLYFSWQYQGFEETCCLNLQGRRANLVSFIPLTTLNSLVAPSPSSQESGRPFAIAA